MNETTHTRPAVVGDVVRIHGGRATVLSFYAQTSGRWAGQERVVLRWLGGSKVTMFVRNLPRVPVQQSAKVQS